MANESIFLAESKLVTLGGKTLRVKVLTSERDKQRGYQFQKKVPDYNHGLLFVFNNPSSYSFHMRNVYFDLDMLCFNALGAFLGRVPMKATCGSNATQKGSYRAFLTPPDTMFVIECQPGWGDGNLKHEVTRLRF